MAKVIERLEQSARRRARYRRQHVCLHRRCNRPDSGATALGLRRRLRSIDRKTARSRNSPADHRRNARAGRRLGEPAAARRRRRTGVADRLCRRVPQAAGRQDAGGSRQDARRVAGRNRHRSNSGRGPARGHRLLPDERGKRRAGAQPALGRAGLGRVFRCNPKACFWKTASHPRAYGNFARFLGRYVRDGGLVPLAEAIRRLTRMPAETWPLTDRGCLDPGCYADIVVFDPDTIIDHSTYAEPHQLATGVDHVFVNGVQVLADGEHTGATPGRVCAAPVTPAISERVLRRT